tara:strand:- start:48 stop:455 length:408 start_codon:yes stop_codon:yes gene_type:complete
MNSKTHISLIKTVNNSPNLFTTSIIREFKIEADEPIDHGGQNLAPTPFDLLNSALASCTCIYLRIIATKYKIDTGDISIRIKISKNEDKSFLFDRKITIEKEINEEQKNFLLEKSNFSPTTIVLKGGNTIVTSLK